MTHTSTRTECTEQKRSISNFDAELKLAEEAIVYFDTDIYDVRQRMEPFLNNSHLTADQQKKVKELRAKFLHCLVENGLLDIWGVAAEIE